MTASSSKTNDVKLVNNIDELNQHFLLNKDKLILLHFHASWCDASKRSEPQLTTWSIDSNYSDIVFLKCDIKQGKRLFDYYEISAIPTYMLFKNGEPCSPVITEAQMSLIKKYSLCKTIPHHLQQKIMLSESDILRMVDEFANNENQSGLTTTLAAKNLFALNEIDDDENTDLPEFSTKFYKDLRQLNKQDMKNWKRMTRRAAYKLSGPYDDNELNKEDIVVISFNINNPELDHDALETINNQVIVHSQKEMCLESVRSIVSEKILFITSAQSAEEIISLIHDEETLDSVFVIMDDSELNSGLLKLQFPKIVDVFTSSSELLNSLRTNVQLIPKQLATYNLFNSKQSNSMNLNKDSAIFLWFQLLKDAILRLKPQSLPAAVNDMVKKCQEYYRGNRNEEENIQKFKQDYENQQNHQQEIPNLAIRWYTKASFVHKMINKAMRTEDIDQVYTFRFYIAELSANIARVHEEQMNGKFNAEFYRGLRLRIDEIDKLKENVGNVISLNGFLSASKSLKVARRYAHGTSSRKDTESVIMIFSIKAKDKLKSVKFADISNEDLVDYPEEEEVLFDLGSVFRIESVLDPYNGDYAVIMVATDIGTQLVDQHLTLNNELIKENGINIVFGKLLFKSGQHAKALQYFETLLFSGKEDDAAVYSEIGTCYGWKNEYSKAISFDQHSFNLYMNRETPNIAKASLIMHKIGNTYVSAGMNSLGFACIRRAAEMYKSVFPADHYQNIIVLKDMTLIYLLEKNYDEAKYYVSKALEMCSRILPTDHDETAACIHTMGNIYHKEDKLDMALDCYMKALEMFKKVLPSDHHDISVALRGMANIYQSQKKYEEALKCYKESLKIEKRFWPIHHPVLLHISEEMSKLATLLHYQKRVADNIETLGHFINPKFIQYTIKQFIKDSADQDDDSDKSDD